ILNDLFLAIKIREGDVKAFERVFKLYFARLSLYAAGITNDMDAAEEIVQELFYVLWRDKENLHLAYSLKSYLYGAVRKESLQYCEHEEVKRRYQETVMEKTSEEETGDAHGEMEYRELQALVEKALGKLPERCARIFRMQRFEHKKYADIAVQLSLSVKTVEADMSKALQALRKEINIYYNN